MTPLNSFTADTTAPTSLCVAPHVSLLQLSEISASAVFSLAAALGYSTALAPEVALMPIRAWLASASFASSASCAFKLTLAATSTRPVSCGLSHVVALTVATNPVTTSLVALALLPGLVAMSKRPARCELALAAALAVETTQVAVFVTSHVA